MILTESNLKQIIAEELENLLNEEQLEEDIKDFLSNLSSKIKQKFINLPDKAKSIVQKNIKKGANAAMIASLIASLHSGDTTTPLQDEPEQTSISQSQRPRPKEQSSKEKTKKSISKKQKSISKKQKSDDSFFAALQASKENPANETQINVNNSNLSMKSKNAINKYLADSMQLSNKINVTLKSGEKKQFSIKDLIEKSIKAASKKSSGRSENLGGLSDLEFFNNMKNWIRSGKGDNGKLLPQNDSLMNFLIKAAREANIEFAP